MTVYVHLLDEGVGEGLDLSAELAQSGSRVSAERGGIQRIPETWEPEKTAV